MIPDDAPPPSGRGGYLLDGVVTTANLPAPSGPAPGAPSPLGRLLEHLAETLPPPTLEEAARINAWWERMDDRRRRLAEDTEETR